MIPPITKLLIKIDQLEWDLAEIKKELEALQAPFMKALTPEERAAVYSARTRAQNQRRHAVIKKALGEPEPNAENLTAEKLQQLLLQDGMKQEDNVGSRSIIKEREN